MHTLLPPSLAVSAAGKHRVLIVDDHNFFAACLRTLLDNESDLVVCDITTGSETMNSRIDRLRPDLLVIDLSLGTENGLELGRRLRERKVMTPILFISTLGRPTEAQMDTVPASSFIAKSKKPTEFLAALRSTLSPRASVAGTKHPLGFAVATTKP